MLQIDSHLIRVLSSSSSSSNFPDSDDSNKDALRFIQALSSDQQQRRRKKEKSIRTKYKRKREKPVTEQESERFRMQRQEDFVRMKQNQQGQPSIWSFESLFPDPVWDEDTIQRDLYEVAERDQQTQKQQIKGNTGSAATRNDSSGGGTTATEKSGSSGNKKKLYSKIKSSTFGAPSMMRIWRDPKLESNLLTGRPGGKTTNQSQPAAKPNPQDDVIAQVINTEEDVIAKAVAQIGDKPPTAEEIVSSAATPPPEPITTLLANDDDDDNNNKGSSTAPTLTGEYLSSLGNTTSSSAPVDFQMTRMVEDRVYGFRRTPSGEFSYDTSLLSDGAVQFRDGVRLGNPLKVNADRLNFFAKCEMAKGRLEEAQEIYERAIQIDPRDGRAYLGLSRIAGKRRDFMLAKQCLKGGIANSVSFMDGPEGPKRDRGANPYLLQALGSLEEKMGHLSEAEALYISAARSRPSHAAAWVSLAQLRTRKLRQTAAAGRVCYQTAERELKRAGAPMSSHVYTAWAAMEFKKAGDIRRARELFQKAVEVDPKCSAAYLQWGVMEYQKENWDAAEKHFETVLRFDQRNSRVLQAYAIMESKRPDGNNRKAVGLFERALKAKPRDAGVLQAYALFVCNLGDIDAARELLKRGTEVNKRHAPLWQAWGVLETRFGAAEDARNIFQQGIWECAQMAVGQSGGYSCARLWQAWGVLEAREGDHAAARRCFSRALDADNRNVAAITAWTTMEQALGNIEDARHIFERALTQIPAGSNEKASLWRAYELMEQRRGNNDGALQVYQRSMRDMIAVQEETFKEDSPGSASKQSDDKNMKKVLKNSEVEVVRWGDSLGGEVILRNGHIESTVPPSAMKRQRSKKDKSS